MTLGVTGFNLDVESFAGAATHEFKKPTGTPHAGGWERGGGEGGHPPSGYRRRGLPQVRRIRDAPPSSDRNRHLTALLRGQLQTTRGSHGKLGDLADHAGQAAIFQALLHGAEDCRFVTGLGEDHALGRQAGLGQGRREEIALAQAPEHWSVGARENTGREARGGGAVQGALRAASDLVQRAHRQPMARQTPIDRVHAERQDPAAGAVGQFDQANLTPKRVERGWGTM